MGRGCMAALGVVTALGLLCTDTLAGTTGKGSSSEQPFGAAYVGSAKCATCHKQIYDTFMKSGHPWKITKVVDGKPPSSPSPKSRLLLRATPGLISPTLLGVMPGRPVSWTRRAI